MNSDPSQPNTLPTLLRDLRDETTTLLRQEVALAKAELKERQGADFRYKAMVGDRKPPLDYRKAGGAE